MRKSMGTFSLEVSCGNANDASVLAWDGFRLINFCLDLNNNKATA